MKDVLDRPDLRHSRVVVISNGRAGKKDAEATIERISQVLRPKVKELRFLRVRHGSMLTATAAQAVSDGYQIIAALGGDGTQAAIANAVARTEAVMAVLPGGTFNYFGRELGFESCEAALDAILNGHVIRRDVGRVNDAIFLNNASVGLYPQILQNREDIYRRWGRSRLAAYWSVLAGLRDLRRPMRLRVYSDTQTHLFETHLAFVARSAFQLESLGLDGAEAVRNGKFALFIAKARTRREMLAGSLRLAAGRMVRGEDFDLVTADRFVLETNQKVKRLAMDGEQGRARTPLELQVVPGALKVMAPAGYSETAKARNTAI